MYAKKRELITSEVALENAQILAFKLKKLAIARSHKQSRKLIKPAVSVASPAVSLIRPAIRVVSFSLVFSVVS